MGVRKFASQLVHKQQLSPVAYEVRFSSPTDLKFLPGQFMNIEVAPNIRRSYSFSNYDPGDSYLETIVDITPGGPGSRFFELAEIGREVDILAPLGQFVYHESDRPAYLFAAGTGIAPLLSILRHMLLGQGTKRRVELAAGYRHAEHILYAGYLAELAARFPNFTYQNFVSRPEPDWGGSTGYVHQVLDDGIDTADIDAYICGGREMVTDTEQKLISAGVPAHQIFYERFY